MATLHRLWPACFLAFAVGCGNSTADLAARAKSPDPADRFHAVQTVREKAGDGKTALPVLIDALKDENTHVRRDAAKALGNLGPDAREAIRPLQALRRDREPSVRKAAAQALRRIDPAATPVKGV